jgi:hypothetical protein
MEVAMNVPLRGPTRLSSAATPSRQRQSLIAERRFDCVSLTREEFASLAPDAQQEYCRQVRAARPELYAEMPADIIRRWRDNDSRARDRDVRSDHRLALHEGEREIGETP